MAGERQERTDRLVEGGRLHPQGYNAVEGLGEAQVAACRDGPTGQRRSPARPTPEAQRHRARRDDRRPGVTPGTDCANGAIRRQRSLPPRGRDAEGDSVAHSVIELGRATARDG